MLLVQKHYAFSMMLRSGIYTTNNQFFTKIIDNNYHYTIITLLFGGKVLNSHTFYYCFCNFQERFYRLALNLVSKLKTEKHKSH